MFDYKQKYSRKYTANYDSIFRKYELDQQEQELCRLMKMQGYSLTEICRILKISEGTAREAIKNK